MSQHLHIESDPEPLYLVYCPGRPSQAAIKPTQAAAQDAADRAALAYPGHEFMVFECTYTATAGRPPRERERERPQGTLRPTIDAIQF